MLNRMRNDAGQERQNQRAQQLFVALRPGGQHALRLLRIALGELDRLLHLLIAIRRHLLLLPDGRTVPSFREFGYKVMMLVEIFADFVCPWCWIGRRRLEQALQLRRDLPFEIAWRPFRLNPELPAEGMDRAAYLEAKFGRGDRIQGMHASMQRLGAELGLEFHFDRIQRTPNTLTAHRLVRLADRQSRADALAERLYAAYFRDGLDIGQTETLVELAEAAGLDRGEAKRFLDSDEELQTVAAMDAVARQNINGVPFFVFDRRYSLAGAQDPQAFLPVFDALRAET